MTNKDLRFVRRKDIDNTLEVYLELAFICDISLGGWFCISNCFLSQEDMQIVVTKAMEVKIHGTNPPVCDVCGGTPFFPNTRPANRVFEEHLCTAPMHTNGPR